jgi:hypothetical protein
MTRGVTRQHRCIAQLADTTGPCKCVDIVAIVCTSTNVPMATRGLAVHQRNVHKRTHIGRGGLFSAGAVNLPKDPAACPGR